METSIKSNKFCHLLVWLKFKLNINDRHQETNFSAEQSSAWTHTFLPNLQIPQQGLRGITIHTKFCNCIWLNT